MPRQLDDNRVEAKNRTRPNSDAMVELEFFLPAGIGRLSDDLIERCPPNGVTLASFAFSSNQAGKPWREKVNEFEVTIDRLIRITPPIRGH